MIHELELLKSKKKIINFDKYMKQLLVGMQTGVAILKKKIYQLSISIKHALITQQSHL